jgi:hypothetical protein
MYSDGSVPTFQRNLLFHDGSIIASLHSGKEKVHGNIFFTQNFVIKYHCLDAEREFCILSIEFVVFYRV